MRHRVLSIIALCLAPITAHAADWPDLSRPARRVGGGDRDAAVIVAIERYGSVAPVPGAVANARTWYAWLTQTRGVPAERVRLLTDNYGTVEKITQAASEAAQRVQPGGTLWFVFIGHGAPARSGRDGVFVGFDAQQDPDILYARSVPQGAVLERLRERADPTGRVVLVADACFSGKTPEGSALAPGLQPLLPVAGGAGPREGTLILSAGKADQFAGPLPRTARPAFSYLLLGALRGWGDANGDGQVTAAEAIGYVRGVLGSVVKRTQTPELTGGPATAPLAASAGEGPPDLATLVLAGTPPGGGGGTGAGGVARKSRRAPGKVGVFSPTEALVLDLGYQLGFGGDTFEETTTHAIDVGLTWTPGLFELDTRLGLAIGSRTIIDASYSTTDPADWTGLHGKLHAGLRLLSWPDADRAALSPLNLSVGGAAELVYADSDFDGGLGIYVANTVFIDCDLAARVSYTHHFTNKVEVPSTIALSFGLVASRRACE